MGNTDTQTVVCDTSDRRISPPTLRFVHGDDEDPFVEEAAKYLGKNFNAEGLREAAKAGGRIIRVKTVEHLLLYAGRGGFDFYLTDGHFEKGVLTGIDFIRLLREGIDRTSPIILLTNNTSTDMIERAERYRGYAVEKDNWNKLAEILHSRCGFPMWNESVKAYV